MIKATGTEFCSWCHLGTSRGEDLFEGSDNDSGALYHAANCYGELARAESGEFDDADHEQRFREWQKHFGA